MIVRGRGLDSSHCFSKGLLDAAAPIIIPNNFLRQPNDKNHVDDFLQRTACIILGLGILFRPTLIGYAASMPIACSLGFTSGFSSSWDRRTEERQKRKISIGTQNTLVEHHAVHASSKLPKIQGPVRTFICAKYPSDWRHPDTAPLTSPINVHLIFNIFLSNNLGPEKKRFPYERQCTPRFLGSWKTLWRRIFCPSHGGAFFLFD
jgi:hypothetical protein